MFFFFFYQGGLVVLSVSVFKFHYYMVSATAYQQVVNAFIYVIEYLINQI